MYHQQAPSGVLQFRMLRHFDPRLDAESGPLKERAGREIVFPHICGEAGGNSRPCLLERPLHEALSKSAPAVWRADSDAVYKEAFPVLGLVDRLQTLHSIRGENGAVFFPKPCCGESIDHAHHALIVRYQTM